MRLRLAEPSLVEAALRAGDTQALIDLHRSLFGGYRMAAEDEEREDDGDDVDDVDDDDSGDDPDEDSDDDNGERVRNPKLKALSDENARRRAQLKDAKQREADLAAKLKEYEDKDKTDVDRATGEAAELKKTNEALAGTNRKLALQLAFSIDRKYDWHDGAAALRLLDLDGVEIDDDGEVTGMSEAIKSLATKHPYLVKPKDDGGPGSGSTGSGQPPNGRKTKQGTQREVLEKKYSALRNR